MQLIVPNMYYYLENPRRVIFFFFLVLLQLASSPPTTIRRHCSTVVPLDRDITEDGKFVLTLFFPPNYLWRKIHTSKSASLLQDGLSSPCINNAECEYAGGVAVSVLKENAAQPIRQGITPWRVSFQGRMELPWVLAVTVLIAHTCICSHRSQTGEIIDREPVHCSSMYKSS